MAKYKAYPEYKDSGVEWLGEIPTSWQMWKLSHAYEVIGSGTTPTSNNESYFQGDIPWVTTGELREKIIYDTDKKVKESTLQIFPALKIHPAGSVVIAMYGATIGRLGILGVDATTNQACCVMTKSKIINNQYLYYWLQAYRTDIIRLSSGGGQPNINQEKVSSLKFSAPVLNDQTLIVAFLDHETAKIDNLIEKQQQLIELLKEKRQAVISHAVTKGLNPDVPMKDSGVEWLGDVPEHWIIPKIGYFCDVTKLTGFEYTNHWKIDDNGDIIALRGFNVKERYLDLEKTEKISNELSRKLHRSKLYAGDIVLPCTGTLGNACVIKYSDLFHINQNIAKLTFNKSVHDEFAAYWLTSEPFRELIEFNNTSGMQPVLLIGDIRNMPIPLPSIQEQMEISLYLNGKVNVYDLAIQQNEYAIKLLSERRTALISAAVTGKIDVRDWVAPDKQNAEEPQEATA